MRAGQTIRSPLIRALLLGGVALLLTTLALGQVATVPGAAQVRELSGVVTDGQHEPLRGAVVKLEDGKTNAVSSFITGPDGRYEFKRLDSNTDFAVWVSFRNHRSHTHSISKFDSHMAKVINFTMPTF